MHGEISWEEAPIASLDLLKLGHVTFRYPLLGASLGHRSLEKTSAYAHPSTLETKFLVELMNTATAKDAAPLTRFLDEWCGGQRQAARLFGVVLGSTHESRSRPVEKAGAR